MLESPHTAQGPSYDKLKDQLLLAFQLLLDSGYDPDDLTTLLLDDWA